MQGSLAQRLEHLTFNEGVDGSNPSRPNLLLEEGMGTILCVQVFSLGL